MKAIVFFASLLIAGVASAACVEGSKGYITKMNPDTGHSYSEARTCVNGTYMNAAEKAAYVYNPRTSCVEGSKGYVTKYNENGHSYSEARICTNGTYMNAAEAAAYVRVPKNHCKEGARGTARFGDYFKTFDESKARQSIGVVCQNKKWVPVRGF